MVSKYYELGVRHSKMNKSLSFNPFRNKGAPYQFSEWECDWRSVEV